MHLGTFIPILIFLHFCFQVTSPYWRDGQTDRQMDGQDASCGLWDSRIIKCSDCGKNSLKYAHIYATPVMVTDIEVYIEVLSYTLFNG